MAEPVLHAHEPMAFARRTFSASTSRHGVFSLGVLYFARAATVFRRFTLIFSQLDQHALTHTNTHTHIAHGPSTVLTQS